MKHHLPESVLNRNTKADFMIAFRWHWSELEDVMLRKQGRGESQWKWVAPEAVTKLYEHGMKSLDSGWPEWMLWTLFACESIAKKRNLV